MNHQAHQERMIEKYRPYIRSLARKMGFKIRFNHLGMDQEDLKQAGYVALLEILPKIDWQKKSTQQIDRYIRSRLRGGMVDAVRAADPNYRNYYRRGNGKPWFADLEGLPREASMPGADPAALIDTIRFLNSLPHRERRIAFYSLQGFTQPEVAELMAAEGYRRVTASRISQLFKKALSSRRCRDEQ